MSLTTYSSELTPDDRCRRWVTGIALAAAWAGVVTILTLPLAIEWRLLAGLVWAAIMARDIGRLVRSYRQCTRIRIEHSGKLFISSSDGCCNAATLLPGSVVLQRIAWLRFRGESGLRHAELVRPNSAEREDWRRLQVIWRHLGAGQ